MLEKVKVEMNIEVRVNAVTETEVKTFNSYFNVITGCTLFQKVAIGLCALDTKNYET